MKNGTYSYSNDNSIGKYLGQYYYNGNETNCVEVLSRVETIEEALNNKLVFEEADDFTKLNTDKVSRNVYDTDGNLVDNVGSEIKNIETVVRNTSASKFLAIGSTDYSKTITLRTLLSSTGNGELGINLPSYIAEIISYSNAAGRRNMEIEPGNLSYVHSDDTEITMSTNNEEDEFWGEKTWEKAESKIIKETVIETYPNTVVAPFLNIGGSDGKHWTRVSDCVIRFSPMKVTNEDRKGIHGLNERIKVENLEKCLEFYQRLLTKL